MVEKKRYILDTAEVIMGSQFGVMRESREYYIKDTETTRGDGTEGLTFYEVVATFKEEYREEAEKCLNALNKELKLYVWEGVFADYTDGLAFAVAGSKKEAIDLILGTKEVYEGYRRDELKNIKPVVHELNEKVGNWVDGGM